MLHCFSFVTIVFCSLVFVFFSFVSRSCIAFHSKFFLFQKKGGGGEEGRKKEAHCVLALFSLFLKTRLVNLFSHDMSLVLCLALMSLLVHVVWERYLWCLTLCFNLEVTCCLTVGLDPFEKGINNYLTTVH